MKKLLYSLAVPVAILNIVAGMICFRAESLPETPGNDSQQIMEHLDRLVEVMQMIRRNYVDSDKVSAVDMLRSAIMGLTMPLDPYSEYMLPEEMKELDEFTDGEFGGVGIELTMKNGVLTVITPVEGTPAAKAGILSGDQILEIDGVDISKISSDSAVGRMRGEPGTKVTLGIRRNNEEELRTFELTREIIKMRSVRYAQVLPDTRTGYIRITEFVVPTADEFGQELRKLAKIGGDGIDSLIIDLRGNGGGLLESAVKICSMFIKPGELVVTTEGRNDIVSQRADALPDSYRIPDTIKVAVLIDSGSASASEITASCLRDYQRAVLIGTRSFGKGSVQTIQHFSDGSGLKLTIAKYYTKSHTEIHGVGLEPDIEVKISDDDLIKLNEDADYTHRLSVDPQVKAALDYLDK